MSIEVVNESGVAVDEAALAAVARHVLDTMGVSPLAELSVLLVDLAEMERLHRRWMDEPGPTDVLAFPMDELDLRGSRGVPQSAGAAGRDLDPDAGPAAPVLIGDVVLCPQVAARQAADAGHPTADELQLLCTHGVLHLLGFDHEQPEEHAQMFGLQTSLLAAWREGR